MSGLISVDEALRHILADAVPLDAETIPLHEAGSRVLASDIRAQRQQPPFAASAMDGYAVRSVDIAETPVRLRLIGQSAAGHGFSGSVMPGTAVRIFTGAPVPEGADCVVIQENTKPDDGGVHILEPATAQRNIRKAGLDFNAGDILLEAGRRLDPAALALAASADYPAVRVVRAPRVAILATGDELVSPGELHRPDQIIASNSYGVAEIVRQSGGIPVDLGIAADSLEALDESVDRAVAAGAHILVTLGGASVGDHDLVQPALASRGMELDFWKIAMRPGKPLMFGRLGAMKVLGLPGNPVSSLICSHIFLRPLIRAMLGLSYAPDVRTATLTTDMPANDQRQDYVRARIVRDNAGGLMAAPFPVQDSSMLKFLAEANGVIIRQPFAPEAKAGSSSPVLMLR